MHFNENFLLRLGIVVQLLLYINSLLMNMTKYFTDTNKKCFFSFFFLFGVIFCGFATVLLRTEIRPYTLSVRFTLPSPWTTLITGTVAAFSRIKPLL